MLIRQSTDMIYGFKFLFFIRMIMVNTEEKARKYVFPQVMPNFLAEEKSIRSLPYWEVCRECQGACCTNMYATDRNFDNLFNEWDKVIIATTFSGWEYYASKEGKKVPYPKNLNGKTHDKKYCPFNSDDGCAIPEGRPAICTAHICTNGRDPYTKMDALNIPQEITQGVMRGHYLISIALSGLLPAISSRSKLDRYFAKDNANMSRYYSLDKPEIGDRVRFINSTFRKSENIINSHEDFKVKFSFKPIIIPNGT